MPVRLFKYTLSYTHIIHLHEIPPPQPPVLDAGILYAVHNEYALTVDFLARRSRLTYLNVQIEHDDPMARRSGSIFGASGSYARAVGWGRVRVLGKLRWGQRATEVTVVGGVAGRGLLRWWEGLEGLEGSSEVV